MHYRNSCWPRKVATKPVEYVVRLEREAFEYFRPLQHCFREKLERWLAGHQDCLSRLEEIKQQAGRNAKEWDSHQRRQGRRARLAIEREPADITATTYRISGAAVSKTDPLMI